jgi:hypothetical protein
VLVLDDALVLELSPTLGAGDLPGGLSLPALLPTPGVVPDVLVGVCVLAVLPGLEPGDNLPGVVDLALALALAFTSASTLPFEAFFAWAAIRSFCRSTSDLLVCGALAWAGADRLGAAAMACRTRPDAYTTSLHVKLLKA